MTPLYVNKVCRKLLKIVTPEFVKNALVKVAMDKIIKVKNGEVVFEKMY